MEPEKCPGCGAVLTLSRDRRNLVCDFCGNIYPVPDQGGMTLSKDAADAKIVSLYAEAEGYRQKGEHTSEIRVLTEALEIAPDNTATLVKLGRAYRVLKFHAKAVECYEKAIEIDPQCGTAYCNLGAIYLLSGDNQKAAAYYEKGLGLVDRANTSDYAVVLANYAMVVGRMGDKRKAASLLAEAEKLGYKNGKIIRKDLKLSTFHRLFN